MKRWDWRVGTGIGVLGLSALVALPLWGRGPEGAAKLVTATAPKPGAAEMENLSFYLGEWDYTETYGKNGGKNTGLYTSKLGPGGSSLVQTFHSQGPVGDFEGLLVMTWDLREKAYKAYLFGSEFPGCVVESGRFGGDVLVYRGEFSMGDTKLALRNTTRNPAPGKIGSEEYVSTNGGPEKLLVHVEATKR